MSKPVSLVFEVPPSLVGVPLTVVEPDDPLSIATRVTAPDARAIADLETSTRHGWPVEVRVFAVGARSSVGFRVVAEVRVFDRVGAIILDRLPSPPSAWEADVRAALEAIEVRFEPDPPLAIRSWWAT